LIKNWSNGVKKKSAINDLLRVTARLRAPNGCPWDREQNHQTLRWHAVEEVYELMDAIEAGDDDELEEELGDVLFQVVFHSQLARERGAFDFEKVARRITNKLIYRHPHVFGKVKVKDIAEIWTNWEKLKRAEKHGTRHARASALDGIPKHLPALMRVEKLLKKARRAKLVAEPPPKRKLTRARIGRELFALAQYARDRNWSAEELLRAETLRQERIWRKREARRQSASRRQPVRKTQRSQSRNR
jgi:NTP pyrophosphatase (non-canonical NTP hydrolase)